MSVARSSARTAARRASTSLGGVVGAQRDQLVDRARASGAAGSICQTCAQRGQLVATRPSTAARARSVSTTTATAPESDRIHSTCSADDVS